VWEDCGWRERWLCARALGGECECVVCRDVRGIDGEGVSIGGLRVCW
jgi:hypothetical protein